MKNIKNLLLSLAVPFLLISCSQQPKNEETKSVTVKPKYSLAQWSFNRDLKAGDMNTVDFINAAAEMDFEGVEYVSQFFQDKVTDFAYLDSLKAAAKDAGILSLMIQVDEIGNLCASDDDERNAAVELGKKWLDASKYLGCTSMRVNAHGDGTPEEMKAQAIEGIGRLADYANEVGVRLIIENHGSMSSNGAWLADLIAQLSDKNVGTLDDFHNWCYETISGSIWGPCAKEYDYYKGFEELIGTAEGVSVKAFKFDSLGNEPDLDFPKFFKIMKNAGYDGYLGIEYEGTDLSSKEGILKTKALAEKTWNEVY
ncbi:sugar phosphate isomerase/epimerase family protein [Arcticibacterium luteifluviistationis]|uniref:Xylose isomerase n=1 Tax=Arcticibacterium luteifluviistationis TaxID=1784714 RepID=A0A2Z4GH75_9BACT|nr:sugar phosphate isomerase/epimerase family protein [Arcticibacterium luteifluviistationis]AWW00773.1 xylose isomerase [Arcticibacterium luteifluviistationis]